MPRKHLALMLIVGALVSPAAHAWFFIFPIPNLAKPAPLNALIDALEKSDETKAVAYVSEDKTFGSKMWAWGHYSGHVTQAEADRIALSRCQESLAKAKAQAAGGNPLYDFGNKTCELHDFVNKKVSPLATQPQPSSPPSPPQPDSAATQSIAPKPETPPQSAPAVTIQAPTPITTPHSAPPVSSSTTPAAQSVATPPTANVTPSPSNAAEKTPTPSVTRTSTPADSPIAKRLRELNDLRQQGLITEAEYAEKRKAILSAM